MQAGRIEQESKKICRLCRSGFDSEPLLAMKPFPKAAQYYPDESEFDEDIGIELEAYKCPYCDLLQLSCEPVWYYKEVITAASFSGDAKAARLKEFKAFADRFGLAGKKVIEIGCGKGGMLDVLSEAGMQAVGLEYSLESVDFGRRNGRDMIPGYLCELGEEHKAKYDAFVSLNYIEHQPDTFDFVRALYDITTDDAVGYITAPNVSYLLKTNTLYEFVADHLIYFTQETMRRAFEMNGFEVVESQIINNENDIALVVKKRKLEPICGIEDVNSLINDLTSLVETEHKKGNRVAVWGAGHRTLALLAMAKLGHIEFIVDSADFKQGKYSPVTHMKIVSPEFFEESSVENVIIMLPGLYPNEVIKKVKSFDRKICIYKLDNNKIMEI